LDPRDLQPLSDSCSGGSSSLNPLNLVEELIDVPDELRLMLIGNPIVAVDIYYIILNI